MPSLTSKTKKLLILAKSCLEIEITNYRILQFHMKSRVCLKYSVNDCFVIYVLIIEFHDRKLKYNISSGIIKIKTTENSSPKTITHLDDFKIHVPGLYLSPTTEAS